LKIITIINKLCHGYHFILLLIAFLTLSIVVSSAFASDGKNQTFLVNFESIVVKNTHDPPTEATRWDLDAYVNGERIRLNPGGELSSISAGKEIPLGIQRQIEVPVNETLRILTVGIDEEQGTNAQSPETNVYDTELQDFTAKIQNVTITPAIGPISFEINLNEFFKRISNEITKILVKQNEPLGVISKIFTPTNGFGIGTHIDCSEMNTGLIKLEQQQLTACDFILKYTITEVNRTSSYEAWNPNNWKVIEGKSIFSNPVAISNGPGKFDIFAVGLDGVLWHKGFDYGWNGWEPLSTYSNNPGIFLPSNSTIGVSSWGPPRLDVFVKGQENSIAHKWLEISKGQWQKDWLPFPPNFSSGPSVFSISPENMSLFAIDAKHNLCANTFNSMTGAWIGWRTMPTRNVDCSQSTNQDLLTAFRAPTCPAIECNLLESLENYTLKYPPVVIPTFQKRFDAFALIDDNKIWHGVYDFDKYDGWTLHNSRNITQYNFTSPPSVMSKSKTAVELELFAQITDGTLISATYDGTEWTNWTSLGKIESPPSVIYWQDPERTYVFSKQGASLIYNWKGYH